MIDLLKHYDLQGTALNNRVVMAPMTRSRAVNPEHKANDLIALYYAQRASAGLIISEGTPVSERAVGYINLPGIYTQAQTEAWKQVTGQVHRNQGVIFAQLWHVGRISHPDLLGGQLPLAPSAINPNVEAYTEKGFTTTVTPKAIDKAEISATVLDFQKAADNALSAGFDGVEIHAANGYLFHQFFMKCSNHRTDEYGGSIENRSRFLFEVIESIAEKVDLSKVGVRISPELTGMFGMAGDDDAAALFEYVVSKLNDYNLAYLHLSGVSSHPAPDQQMIRMARKYRTLYKGTLIINGGFNKEKAEKALADNIADLISFGSPFIANPDLVERFRLDAPLNAVNRNTVYGTGAEGFTDYPVFKK